MNAIDDELRELFLRKAEDVPPHREVPQSLVRRARRRIVLNALIVGVGVVVLAAGAFAGVRALGGGPAHQPAGRTIHPPVRPTTSASATLACTSSQLRAVASLQGAAGSLEGAISVTNLSSETCTLEGTPAITLLDQNLDPIGSGVTFSSSPAGWVVDGSPKPKGWPIVTLGPRGSASVRILWSNWCPDGRAMPAWGVGVSGDGAVDVNGLDAVTPPPCNGPGQPSTIEVGPFEPRAGP
jgi:hypothetical protein